MLKFDLTLFNDNTEGERYSDMSAVDIKVGVVLGQIRVVFVNKFVTDMLVSVLQLIAKVLDIKNIPLITLKFEQHKQA